MLAMSHEDVDEATAHFSAVLLLATDLDDHELVAIAHFWKARCLRKRGEYEAAMAHTVLARTTALQCGCERMAAVMRTLESWLLFQKGRHKESLKVLADTEAMLRDTDDYVTLGNIQSTYGRIYRQAGRYDSAISRFRMAVEFYRTAAPQHVNLARTLANWLTWNAWSRWNSDAKSKKMSNGAETDGQVHSGHLRRPRRTTVTSSNVYGTSHSRIWTKRRSSTKHI